MLRLAISLALLASGGALTAAAQRYLHRAPPAPAALPPPAPASLQAPARARTPAPPAPPALAPPDEPAPRFEASPRRTHRVADPSAVRPPALSEQAPVVPPPVPPAATPSALAEESALVAEALRRLRQADDAPAALALLDAHAQRFPAGALAPEATLARIEALFKMHRTDDALSLLDRTTPVPRGRGRDLLVARAELRAKAGRRAAAIEDFDQLLTGDPVLDPITERALWGRAACRAAAGDAPGARRDLEDYLSRFPEGRFARDARAALRP
jgi:tetratricopeptide (TPR) repeat protein